MQTVVSIAGKDMLKGWIDYEAAKIGNVPNNRDISYT